MRIAVALAVLLATRTAGAATCDYFNDYYEPDLTGGCSAETMVPEGCPLHVQTPAGEPPVFVVHRGDELPELPATTAVVETISLELNVIDVLDCACGRRPQPFDFDRHAITVEGLVAGDTVEVVGKVRTVTSISIGPAAPCPVPAWPTVSVSTRCDLCGGNDGTGDPEDTGAGCSAGGGSLALALLVLAGLVGRRRC